MGAPLPGGVLDLALLSVAVGVVLLGPGRLSLDHAVGIEGAGFLGAAVTALA